MTVDATVPILFVQQQGPAGRLAHDLATHPEAAQQMARHTAAVSVRRQAGQVQQTDDIACFVAINDEERDHGQGLGKEPRRNASAAEDAVSEQETTPSSEGPFLGNLVNRKV